MSNAEDVKAESKEADPNIVSIKVRGQVRTSGAARVSERLFLLVSSRF
jgi:hypothetical protein|eukprot:COSAG02_NODE_3815_length_6192_cov_2.112260_11_plen_48_part_00